MNDDVFVQDRTACVWRLPDLVSVVVLRGHKRGIWSVEFSPVDQCVITASGDKTIKIWAIADGSCLKTFEGHTSSVLRASFLTRGTQFVSCGNEAYFTLAFSYLGVVLSHSFHSYTISSFILKPNFFLFLSSYLKSTWELF